MSDGHDLTLEVKPTGVRCWYYRYKIGIKCRKIPLGYYPDLGLLEARVEAVNWAVQRRNKDALVAVDPLEVRNAKILERRLELEAIAFQP